MSINEPFGRQPKPVTITISGEKLDVDYWHRTLMRRASFKGDNVEETTHSASFIIYPRAVND